jgi:4-carboxymuconolactone decarboxylase
MTSNGPGSPISGSKPEDVSEVATAGELLGRPLELPLAPGEPESGHGFRRLATLHTFGDGWPRTQQLDTRTRGLISVAIAAALGTHEPLRGQLRIALSNGVSKDEMLSSSCHLEAYAGAARAFDSYQIATADGAFTV